MRSTTLAFLSVPILVALASGTDAGHWLRTARHWIHAASAQSAPAGQRHFDDDFGRVAGKSGFEPIECPSQDERSAVLLLAGQSNAGNNSSYKGSSEHGNHILNYFDGHCYRAASPLLGSTGSEGEHWTLLANLLVQGKTFDTVILAPVAVGGSSITRWSKPGTDLNVALLRTVHALQRDRLTITHVLWTQGETDAEKGMDQETYRGHFLSITKSLRDAGVRAPIFVAISTHCWGNAARQTENPVSLALRSLPDADASIRLGADADRLMNNVDRYNGCHMGPTGAAKIARAWSAIISGTTTR